MLPVVICLVWRPTVRTERSGQIPIFALNTSCLKQFLKSAFYITAGAALPLMASVVLLIPYTENLSTARYGELAIYISFALLMQIVMNYGIDTYLSVHYYDHKDEPTALKKFLSEITGAIFIIGFITTAFFLAAGHFLFSYLFSDGLIRFFPYGLMSVATAFFNAFFRTYMNLQVFGNKAAKYFWLAVFNFVVTVVISAAGVYMYPETIIGPMWGRFLSGVLIFLLSFYFVIREFGIKFSTVVFPELRVYCTPVFIFSALTWVLGYINNFILNALATPADVGVYDFALKCTLIVEFAALGISSAANPRIYQIWKKNQVAESTKEENKYNHVFSMACVLLVAVNIFLLPPVIRLFVNTEGYYESIKYLPVLLAGFVFRALFNTLINPIYYFKKTKLLPRLFAVSAIIQIVLGIVLIKYFGIWGAVWSYFLVKPVQLILLWLTTRKIFAFRFNIVKMLLMPAAYCAVVIVVYQYGGFNTTTSNLIQLSAALILILAVYRKELRELPMMWKKA